MARKVINRKELRAEYDAAAAAEAAGKAAEGKEKVTKPKKKAAPRVSREGCRRRADETLLGRLQSIAQCIAVYDFDQKEEAEKKAEELSKSGKSPRLCPEGQRGG